MPALADCIQPLLKAHRRLASDLTDLCREVNHEVYLVGGSVRDTVLGRTVHDMDLTLAADGLELGRKLAARLRCPFVPLDDTDRTGRVVLRRGFTIDISSFKGDTLEEDLRKRDFTINAMAFRLADVLDGRPSLIDPLGGAADLAARRLKAVSEAAFRDDPLRILRAFRLAGQFKLEITPETAGWIEAGNEDLRAVSGERVLYELALILDARSTAARVSAMVRAGVFRTLLSGWKEPATPALARALERMDRLIARDVFLEDHELYAHLPGYGTKLAGGRSFLWILRFASLVLHRIRAGGGDPALEMIERADPALETAERADPALETVERAADRLRLSNRERQGLHQLVFGAARLLEAAARRDPDDEALCRILRGAKGDTPGAALLALAHGSDEGSAACGRIAKAVRRLLVLFTRYGTVRTKGLLLNGADIMDDLGIPEGREIGRMLDRLETIQIIHDIRTRAQARKLLYEDTGTGAGRA